MSILLLLLIFWSPQTPDSPLTGAWQIEKDDGTTGIWIITNENFSISYYKSDPPEFLYTEGGKLEIGKEKMTFTWEYHTNKSELVGTSAAHPYITELDIIGMYDSKWKRIDNGTPGKLAGAWLITGRERNGELREITPGARKTMKILSGTRFQWIAYNSETAQFSGTGGGTYTTMDGKYTENIEFFSRDNNRVGASLEFNYAIKDEKWEHSGKSSRGDPLFEIWSRRSVLGI